MKRHILIDPGMLPTNRLVNIFGNTNQNIKLSILTEGRRKKEYRLLKKLGLPIVFYEDFFHVHNENLNSDNLTFYNKAVKDILSDSRTFLIAERVNKINYWNSLFNKIPLIEKIIYNFLCFQQSNPIDEILFQATPHNLPNWVLAKTAEIAGIKVKMIQTSPLPWRYWIVEGLDLQKPIYPTNQETNEEDIYILEKYIELNKSNYTKALPEYEKKRLDSRNGKYWSWQKEIKDLFKHPQKILYLYTKRKNYLLYRRLSKEPIPQQKNVVFFLHFQPERTSMPEGFHFSNQWLIIKQIAACLPTDVVLYVKEHPSMFTNNFDSRYRDRWFYYGIEKLNNAQLLPLDCDTFELIDNAIAIITITGTVGVQSLIRNKPVITFGTSSYREFKNVFAVKEKSDIKEIVKLVSNRTLDNNVEFKNIFHEILPQTIGTLKYTCCGSKPISFYHKDNRITGHLRLLNIYLLE